MKIIKLLLILFTITTSVFATSHKLPKSMGYAYDYKSAIEQAKKENKPLMLVIEERYCPWCEKLSDKTLSHPKLAQMIKKSFVGVQLIQDTDFIPNDFYADVFPTVFFINPYNEDYYFKSRGYKGAVKFKKRLLHAMRSHKDR